MFITTNKMMDSNKNNFLYWWIHIVFHQWNEYYKWLAKAEADAKAKAEADAIKANAEIDPSGYFSADEVRNALGSLCECL